MAQFLRPDADVSAGLWTATPLWSKVDDTPGSGDADLVTSNNNTSPDTFEVGLTAPAGTPVAGTRTLRVRISKSATGGHALTYRVGLYDASTLIQEFTGSVPDSTAFSTLALTVTNAITWTDLRVRVAREGATGGAGGTRRSLIVSSIEFEVPDDGAAAQNIDAGFIDRTAVASAPTITTGPVSVSPNLITQTAAIHAPTVAVAGSEYARDDFGRTSPDTWGDADVGGTYTIKEGTTTEFDVASGRGTILVGGVFQGKQIALDSVSQQDVDMKYRGQANKLATGTDAYVTWMLQGRRISGQDTRYLGFLRALVDGTPQIRISRVVAGVSTELVAWTTVPGSVTANTDWWLRFQLEGVSPTTLRVKAWPDGGSEPDWQGTTTDSTAALQAAGAVGIQAFNSPGITNNPVIYSFDEYRVSAISAGSGVSVGLINQTAVAHAPVVTGGELLIVLDRLEYAGFVPPLAIAITGKRLYFRQVKAHTGTSGDQQALLARGPQAGTSVTNTVAGPTSGVRITGSAGGQALFWLTRPLASQATIAGAISFTIWAQESDFAANAGLRVKVYRCDANGGVLSTIADSAAPGELATNMAVSEWTVAAGDVTDTVVAAGERIGFEILIDDAGGNMAAGHTVTVAYDDDNTSVAGDSWIELSESIVEGGTYYSAVSDPFETNGTDSWPDAPTGGIYTLKGSQSDYDVAGGVATMVNNAASTSEATRSAVLEDVKVQDIDLTAEVETDKAPTGNQQVHLMSRVVDENNLYRFHVQFTTSNAVQCSIERKVGDVYGRIGSLVTTGLTHAPGTRFKMRFQTSGVNPTSLKGKVWLASESEPGTWNTEQTDSSAPLQRAAAVGLRSWMETASNLPVTVTWDNFASAFQGVTLGLINQTAVAHAPTVTSIRAVALGLITQSAATFAPTVAASTSIVVGRVTQLADAFGPTITTQSTSGVGLIDRTAVIFNLTVIRQQFVSVALISQTAAIHAPAASSVFAISVGLINRTSTAGTPTITTANTVSVALINRTATASAPTVATGAVSASVGLINQTAQPRTPTVTATAAISVGLISQPAAALAPSVGTGIALGLIVQTAAISTPTATSLATISVGTITQTAAPFAPAVATGATAVIPDLINRTAVAFEPTASAGGTVVELGLIDRTATASAPTITAGAVGVSLELISQTAAIHEPALTTATTALVELINQAATASAPTITTVSSISVGVIVQTAAAFSPTVIPDQFVTLAQIDRTAVLFDVVIDTGQIVLALPTIDRSAAAQQPSVSAGAVGVSVGLINQTAAASTPAILAFNTVAVGLINQAASANAPSIATGSPALTVGLINRTAAAFTPTISAGGAVVELDLISLPAESFGPAISTSNTLLLSRIEQPAAALDPTITSTGDQDVVLTLINQSAIARMPSVTGGEPQEHLELAYIGGGYYG